MKIWRQSGTLMMLTGTLHVLLAVVAGWTVYGEMLRDKLLNSVGSDFQRGFHFWFLMIGVLLIFWGQTLQFYIKRNEEPAPLFIGYALLLMSVIGCMVIPVSGFWLFIPQALIIMLAKRKNRKSV